MKSKIRNIIFDMGGVLLDLNRSDCVAAFIELGFPQVEQMLSKYAQTGILGDLERGHVTPEKFYDYVRRESRRDITDENIANALNRFIVGLPLHKLQMLLDLRKRFNIYMLSNTNAVMLPHIKKTYFTQQGLEFEDYFDRVFLSYEMGEIKPDAEIFLQMIRDGGMDPKESLFIDDGEANTDIAAQLDFHTYLAREKEDFRHIFNDL